jgi:hypothetical protein
MWQGSASERRKTVYLRKSASICGCLLVFRPYLRSFVFIRGLEKSFPPR